MASTAHTPFHGDRSACHVSLVFSMFFFCSSFSFVFVMFCPPLPSHIHRCQAVDAMVCELRLIHLRTPPPPRPNVLARGEQQTFSHTWIMQIAGKGNGRVPCTTSSYLMFFLHLAISCMHYMITSRSRDTCDNECNRHKWRKINWNRIRFVAGIRCRFAHCFFFESHRLLRWHINWIHWSCYDIHLCHWCLCKTIGPTFTKHIRSAIA